jgi:hypothetical protein
VISCVPAKEQFERVRCTVLDIAFPFYSLPIKSRSGLRKHAIQLLRDQKKLRNWRVICFSLEEQQVEHQQIGISVILLFFALSLSIIHRKIRVHTL